VSVRSSFAANMHAHRQWAVAKLRPEMFEKLLHKEYVGGLSAYRSSSMLPRVPWWAIDDDHDLTFIFCSPGSIDK
jgi:hypothetical protein